MVTIMYMVSGGALLWFIQASWQYQSAKKALLNYFVTNEKGVTIVRITQGFRGTHKEAEIEWAKKRPDLRYEKKKKMLQVARIVFWISAILLAITYFFFR